MDFTTQWHGIQAKCNVSSISPSIPAPSCTCWSWKDHLDLSSSLEFLQTCISWSFSTCYTWVIMSITWVLHEYYMLKKTLQTRVECSWHSRRSRRQLNEVQGSKRLSCPPWQWDLPKSPPWDIGHQSHPVAWHLRSPSSPWLASTLHLIFWWLRNMRNQCEICIPSLSCWSQLAPSRSLENEWKTPPSSRFHRCLAYCTACTEPGLQITEWGGNMSATSARTAQRFHL